MHSANDAGPVEDATGIRKRFRTLIEIGRGGMAQVFLAESVSFDVRKLVVLKVLNSEFAAHPEMRAAFRREADISARMNHPNVVQVFEVVEQAGQTIIVMEYLDGLPLSRVLRQTRIPLVLHLDILSQVLGGLHHFHELRDIDDSPLNAVHRDVSPQNVLLLHEGVAKVLDFGVAKFTAGDPDHTRSGLIKGKIHYMPPEQLLGDTAVDRRADIFALGAMMWEALAGRRLWHGLPERDVMRALARGEIPSLRAFAPDAAPELEAIVNKALAPDAEQRFRTASDMQQALEHAMPATVGIAHPRELAAYMQEHFGEARKRQKMKLDEARRNPTTADLVLEAYRPPSLGDLTVAEPLPAVEYSEVSQAPAEVGQSVAAAAPRKRYALLAGAAFMLVLGAGGVAFGVYSARAAKPTAEATSPAPVRFHVLTDQAEAEIVLDDVVLGKGSYQGQRPVSSREHRLLIRAPGHVSLEEAVRFDADVVRLLRLEPNPAPAISADTAFVPAAVGEEPDRGEPEKAARAPGVSAKVAKAGQVERSGLPEVASQQPHAVASQSAAGGTAPAAPIDVPKLASAAVPAPPPTPTIEAPLRPKQLAPKIGHSRLNVDVSADPYRVRLPPALNRMGAKLETLVKICVAPSGGVSSVAVVRSADPALDRQLMSTIPRWRYNPLVEEARAIPFCYTLNLRFEGRRN